jgi:hypothetical protein
MLCCVITVGSQKATTLSVVSSIRVTGLDTMYSPTIGRHQRFPLTFRERSPAALRKNTINRHDEPHPLSQVDKTSPLLERSSSTRTINYVLASSEVCHKVSLSEPKDESSL